MKTRVEGSPRCTLPAGYHYAGNGAGNSGGRRGLTPMGTCRRALPSRALDGAGGNGPFRSRPGAGVPASFWTREPVFFSLVGGLGTRTDHHVGIRFHSSGWSGHHFPVVAAGT